MVTKHSPMHLTTIISEFLKGKGKFNVLGDGFSTLIESTVLHKDYEGSGLKQTKRVELPETFILHYSKPNELIADFFCGAGSTLIASEKNNRNCYLMEFEPKHCDITALMKELEASFKKHRNSPRQVFLSFLTDPYSHFNKESLTFTDKEMSKKWEKNSSDPEERFMALEILHEEGVRTWASMEPVIFPDQSLEIMELTKDCIDGYKIGKLNHFKNHEKKFDWTKFLTDAVGIMRKNNELFYIKKDLLEWKAPDLHLEPHETDMDYMALKNTFQKTIFA